MNTELNSNLDICFDTYFVILNKYIDTYISIVLSSYDINSFNNCVYIKVFNDYELANKHHQDITRNINHFTRNILTISSQLSNIQEQYNITINNIIKGNI